MGIVRCDERNLGREFWSRWEKYLDQLPRYADDEEMIELARKVASDNIVFLGHMEGGNPGNVFTHRNSRGEIDSLIILDWNFFSRDEIDNDYDSD